MAHFWNFDQEADIYSYKYTKKSPGPEDTLPYPICSSLSRNHRSNSYLKILYFHRMKNVGSILIHGLKIKFNPDFDRIVQYIDVGILDVQLACRFRDIFRAVYWCTFLEPVRWKASSSHPCSLPRTWLVYPDSQRGSHLLAIEPITLSGVVYGKTSFSIL